MALSFYNIKKWARMLTGKSVLHVNQDMGKSFVPGKLEGYFNNMTEKVTKEPALLESDDLPRLTIESGEQVFFPVAIFQYGLGAYDLFLQTNDSRYLKKFEQCAEWAVKNQEEKGAWNNFFFIYPENPYGAMCQGEGVSLLLRAYKALDNEKFLISAKKAMDYMLLSVYEGGTAVYESDGLILREYMHRPPVLNGWVFAMFGLYDMTLVLPDEKKYISAWINSLSKLKTVLPLHDNGYWSLYDMDKRIASPFYHNLHIAQMEALYITTNDEIFRKYWECWKKYKNKFWNSKRAFLKKSIQKILE